MLPGLLAKHRLSQLLTEKCKINENIKMIESDFKMV